MAEKEKQKRGFAAMSPERQKEIAAKGGRAVPDSKRSFSVDRKLASKAGMVGGQKSTGNFKHNPKRAAECGAKGGGESPSNFKNDKKLARRAGKIGGSR